MFNNIVNDKKGFTLVELLATIVILGIISGFGITAGFNLLNKSKNNQVVQQKKQLIMAAETYVQENRSKLPKNVGSSYSVKIYLSELKNANYIKSDVVDGNKDACNMSTSYVEVTKVGDAKYTYEVNLFCG